MPSMEATSYVDVSLFISVMLPVPQGGERFTGAGQRTSILSLVRLVAGDHAEHVARLGRGGAERTT